MRDASTVQQVSDDAGLLKLMMDDMAAAPELYRPGNYWKNYENLFVPEIANLGLRDFRRRRDSVLTTFGATDDPPSDVEYYSRRAAHERQDTSALRPWRGLCCLGPQACPASCGTPLPLRALRFGT